MKEATRRLREPASLRWRAIVTVACFALAAVAMTGCQREAPSGEAPETSSGATEQVDVRALVPAGYVEPDRTWIPPIMTFRVQSVGASRVLVLTGWRGAAPFEVRVFANDTLVGSRTFEAGRFEMNVEIPAQAGPETAVRIETTPAINPTGGDLRPKGFVVRSIELRRAASP